MITLARWLARRLWAAMLWFQRRPWIRHMQLAAINLRPPHKRERAWERLKASERFARRVGLKVLQTVILALLVSITLCVVYEIANRFVGENIVPYLDRQGGVHPYK